MGFARYVAAALAVAALLAGAPAAAQSDLESAEKLRRLDIMLMVTALRCRFGADNFQPDYEAFSARHLTTLNAAASELRQALAAQHGTQGARRAVGGGSKCNELGADLLRQLHGDTAIDEDRTRLEEVRFRFLADRQFLALVVFVFVHHRG
jgi:hypothetical protein